MEWSKQSPYAFSPVLKIAQGKIDHFEVFVTPVSEQAATKQLYLPKQNFTLAKYDQKSFQQP